jgi:transcriptional regulator with XRE-family HTH domain
MNEQRLTQKGLARLAKVPHGAIQRFLKGKNMPIDRLETILGTLGYELRLMPLKEQHRCQSAPQASASVAVQFLMAPDAPAA